MRSNENFICDSEVKKFNEEEKKEEIKRKGGGGKKRLRKITNRGIIQNHSERLISGPERTRKNGNKYAKRKKKKKENWKTAEFVGREGFESKVHKGERRREDSDFELLQSEYLLPG